MYKRQVLMFLLSAGTELSEVLPATAVTITDTPSTDVYKRQLLCTDSLLSVCVKQNLKKQAVAVVNGNAKNIGKIRLF